MVAKNPREPKNVKKLISDAKVRQGKTEGQDHDRAIAVATLWAKIRRRGQGQGS